jgi:aminoglycoside 3-N-acetyltransferase
VGNTGTVLVPTLTFGAKELLADNPHVFDPKRTPCYTGRIPEVFRQRKDAVRSVHPTHSVAAIGPHTGYLIQDAEKSQTPCGRNSPFYKLIELDGYILLLGTAFESITSGHVIEDVVPDFPVEVYLKEPVNVRYLNNNGVEKTMMFKLHDPKVAIRRMGNRKEKREEIFGHCLKRGIIKTGYIGIVTYTPE